MKPRRRLGRVGEAGVALEVEVCSVAVAAGIADPIIILSNTLVPHKTPKGEGTLSQQGGEV